MQSFRTPRPFVSPKNSKCGGIGSTIFYWCGILLFVLFIRVFERFDKTIVSAWRIAVSMMLCTLGSVSSNPAFYH